jgi:hypothetical protein
MTHRPCKPDADLKWLWRTLLGSTPLPVCGTPEQADSAPTVSDLLSEADRDARKSQNRGS